MRTPRTPIGSIPAALAACGSDDAPTAPDRHVFDPIDHPEDIPPAGNPDGQ